MVKVGIFNAESRLAGEIIRILVNHPETDLHALLSPSNYGRSLTSVHHGLIGEQNLKFADKLDLDEIDFLIIPEDYEGTEDLIHKLAKKENIKAVLVPQKSFVISPSNFQPGLSEINRKKLVREAVQAVILPPAVIGALVALAPLADFLLLNSDLFIEVSLPSDIVEKTDILFCENLIESILKFRQVSFNGKIRLKLLSNEKSDRGAFTRISLLNSLQIDELEKIYEERYDDHNFSFLVHGPLDIREVEGTQKIVMSINKDKVDSLDLDVVYDARMRGGAGDIVHVMNLFFGLHEKTGLHFKSSCY